MNTVWRLVVWNITPQHAGLMARLRLIPAKNKPSTFWREYPKRSQVEAAITTLKAAGLHGIARKAEKTPSPKFKRGPTLVSREGFGGTLNARPIAGTWRRKTRHK